VLSDYRRLDVDRCERAVQERRRVLHDWADAWYRRHARDLASEGVQFTVRVGSKTFRVTAEQSLAAMSRTVQELDAALPEHPRWGTDGHGRPCEMAMRGLINRRLASRLVDQLRKAMDLHQTARSLAEALPSGDAGDLTLGDLVAGSSGVDSTETMLWLRQVLADEAPDTREVIVRRIAREPASEISGWVGLTDAATRQRLTRFRRRHAVDLVDAA
jgi:hypothetical protein